jgi:hypothetical protein
MKGKVDDTLQPFSLRNVDSTPLKIGLPVGAQDTVFQENISGIMQT